MTRGYIYKSAGAWHVRFRETYKTNEGIRTVNRSRRLCESRVKRSEARRIADEYLPRVYTENRELAGITLVDFIEREYLPVVKLALAPSTYEGYIAIFKVHGDHIPPGIKLRDVTPFIAHQMMQRIALRSDLSKTSLKHIKSFFSGVFTHALELGAVTGNPMKDIRVPHGRESEDTYAYSPEEIEAMLAVLPEPANSLVLTAACTGLRKSELRGLTWNDWQGETLSISRAYWRSTAKTTKSRASRAPIPVCSDLQRRLLSLSASVVDRTKPIFSGSTGSPLDLNNIVTRVIKPILQAHNREWHGWHAFRRGLATFLHRRGVQDVMIQRILRHSNVSVTQACYIKTVPADIQSAITQLDGAYGIKTGTA